MRKFKHTNTGIIGEVKDYRLYFERCHGELCSQESISMELIENSKDWEENIDPIFLVTNIMYYSDGALAYLREDGTYCYKGVLNEPEVGSTLENCLASNWKINSVLRLLDNKEFTLGDRVYYFDNTFVQWEIDNFYIREDGVMLARSKDNLMVETIDTICKVDPISFRSYDNLELTEKSEYYVVNDKFNFIHNGKPQIYPSFTKNKSKYYVFANKENAINFIIDNKPCLSFNDIDTMMDNTSVYRSDQIKYLRELIKERI